MTSCERVMSDGRVAPGKTENGAAPDALRATRRRRFYCRRTSSMLVAATVLRDLAAAHRPSARALDPIAVTYHSLPSGCSRGGCSNVSKQCSERDSRFALSSSASARSAPQSAARTEVCMNGSTARADSWLPAKSRRRHPAFESSRIGLQVRLPGCRGGAGGTACWGQSTEQVFQPHVTGERRNDSPGPIPRQTEEHRAYVGIHGDSRRSRDVRKPWMRRHQDPDDKVEKVPSPQKSSDHHTALATEGTIRSPQPKPQPQPSPLITPHIVPRVADDVVTMKALGKEGKWEQALEVLKRLKEDAAISGDRSIKPGLEVFNAAVAAVSRSGKLDEALGLLEEMRSAGVEPDVVSFTSVVSAASRSGRAAVAEQILSRMRLEGVIPNAATYNAAISGCSVGGEWDRALRLLREMEATDPREEARPEALSYSLVLKACGRDGQWETALELLEEMEAKGLQPTIFCFRYTLAACCGSGNGSSGEDNRAEAWRRCLCLMEAMDRQGVEPDAVCYKHAVDVATKAGEVEAALDLLDRMEARGGVRDPSPYNQVIVALGLRGEWRRALSILDRARNNGAKRDVHTFAVAMAACARGGAPLEAFRLLEELKREGGNDSGGGSGGDGNSDCDAGVRPNTVVYNTLLVLCKGRPLGKGRRNSGSVLSHNGDREHSLGINGGVAVSEEAGNGQRGADGKMRDASEAEWGRRPEKLAAKAVALLHEMTVAGGQCAPDKMSFELTMQACVNAGRPESALKVFEAMRRRFVTRRGESKGGFRPERATFRLGLTAAAAAGDGVAAASMLDDMHSAGIALDESTLHLAAMAFGRAGLWHEGVILTRKAAEEGVPVSPSTFTSVLGACAKGARWREALEMLDRARPTLRERLTQKDRPVGEEGDGVDAIPAYTLAMAACRASGRYAEGLEVFWSMEEDGGVGCGDKAFFRAALACSARASSVLEERNPDSDLERFASGHVGVGGRERRLQGRASGAAVAERVLELVSLQGCLLGVEGFADAARAYGLAGRWEDALGLLPRAAAAGVRPDERMYCAVINAMGDSGAWREAVELVRAMRVLAGASTGDSEREAAAADAEVVVDVDKGGECCFPMYDGDNQQLLSWLSSLPLPSPPRPGRSAYGCACRAGSLTGQWPAVLELIDDMRRDGVERDPAVYASAIRAFVEAGEWERAVELVTVEMELDGVMPDARSYIQALRACRLGASGDGRAARLAQMLLAEMEDKGLERDVACLEGATRACLADGRADLGLDLLSQALFFRVNDHAGTEFVESRGEEWGSGDVQRLQTMTISLLGRCGRWEEALEMLDVMRKEHGVRLHEGAFVAAAYACASAGQWSVVEVLLSEASGAGTHDGDVPMVSPGAMWDMRRALLAGLAAAGLWQRAAREVRNMHRVRSENPGQFDLKGDGDVKDDGDQARYGVRDVVMHQQRRMLKDYRTVMHACLRARALEEVLCLWCDLRAHISTHAPLTTPCAATYALALRACGALGRWTLARELLNEMRVAGGELAPGAAHYAFAACAAAVADDEAEETSTEWEWGEEAEGEKTGRSGDPPSPGGFPTRDTRLRGLLLEMSVGGFTPGWELYSAVCWARSQKKQWRSASLHVLELMREVGLSDSSGSEDSYGFAEGESGHVAVAAAIPSHVHKVRLEGVRSLYARLLAAAGKVPYGALVGGEEPGDVVRQVLADAEERLASTGGAGPKIFAAAARAFARARDWQGARDSALRIISRSVDSLEVAGEAVSAATVAISAAVGACACAGELDEAESLADLARDVVKGFTNFNADKTGTGLDRRACLKLAKSYELAGRFEDAEALRLNLRGELTARFRVETAVDGEYEDGVGDSERRRLIGEGWTPLVNHDEEEEAMGPNGAHLDSMEHVEDEDSFLSWIGSDSISGKKESTDMVVNVEEEWWEGEKEGGGGGARSGRPQEVLVRKLEGL